MRQARKGEREKAGPYTVEVLLYFAYSGVAKVLVQCLCWKQNYPNYIQWSSKSFVRFDIYGVKLP